MPDDQANPLLPPEGGADSPTVETPSTEAPAGLTVDGVTYTPDQVKALLKDSTDYKQLTPEYTKQQQLLKDPQKLREYIAQTHPDLIPKAPAAGQEGQLTPELQEAFKLIREQGKFMTQEEAQKMVSDALSAREADKFIADERSKLDKEWNGEGGKPKFDFEAVRQHAIQNGFPTLTSAFKDLNEPALLEWYAANKNKPNAPTIAKPGAQSVPVSKEKGPSLSKMGEVKKDALEFFGGEAE